MVKNNDIAFLNYLSQWAVLNDELLQSYRSMFLTFQSIIMAIGVAFFVTIMVIDKSNSSCFLYIILLLIFLSNTFYVIPKMNEILDSRSLNRTFFHFKIMELENRLHSKNRYFTQFVMEYKNMAIISKKKEDEEYKNKLLEVFKSVQNEKLDDETILCLLQQDSTEIQRLFHSNIFYFVRLIWICFIIFSTIYLYTYIIDTFTC